MTEPREALAHDAEQQRRASLLADLRHHAMLTQSELAERVGVVRQTIAAWERGDRSPNVAQLAQLAPHLHVRLIDLIDIPTDSNGWKVRQCR